MILQLDNENIPTETDCEAEIETIISVDIENEDQLQNKSYDTVWSTCVAHISNKCQGHTKSLSSTFV